MKEDYPIEAFLAGDVLITYKKLLFSFKASEMLWISLMLTMEHGHSMNASVDDKTFSGWFNYSQKNMAERFKISQYKQNKIIKKFKNLKIVSTKRSKTMPTYNLYKIDSKRLWGYCDERVKYE